jgi:hypothetical protein
VRAFGFVRAITDADTMRRAIGVIINHPIASARELTAVEADQVLSVLRAEQQQKQAAAAGPAPVGSPDNPEATDRDQKMMNGLLGQAGYGKREDALGLISRILRRPVTTRRGMSRADTRTVIAGAARAGRPDRAVR